jgi:5-dehydro-2-deoxygluconokinase
MVTRPPANSRRSIRFESAAEGRRGHRFLAGSMWEIDPDLERSEVPQLVGVPPMRRRFGSCGTFRAKLGPTNPRTRDPSRRKATMQLGYDKPLYIQPFDHRSSFTKGLFGWSGTLTAEQVAQVAASKQVVYEGFKAAIVRDVPCEAGAILVDEQFGAAILRDAAAAGTITCAPVEKSGQPEFQFEYGDQWRDHIAAFRPDFVKVLVRYNPEGDAEANARQATRLRALSEYVHENSRRLLFELLVPMTPEQSDQVEGHQPLYDQELRPGLMLTTIHELQDAGVEPDVWKVEGLGTRDQCAALVGVARREGRDKVGCIVLGRGADEAGIVAWLKTAAAVPGFIGFAVGRTTFWDALVALRAGKITREIAVANIAHRYAEWTRVFQEARR